MTFGMTFLENPTKEKPNKEKTTIKFPLIVQPHEEAKERARAIENYKLANTFTRYGKNAITVCYQDPIDKGYRIYTYSKNMKLGEGEQGTIYVTQDISEKRNEDLSKFCVVKVSHDKDLADKMTVFSNEEKILKILNRDRGFCSEQVDKNKIFLFSELVGEKSLFEFCYTKTEDGKRLLKAHIDPLNLIQIYRELIKAVINLHNKDILHRDINLSNFRLDFGPDNRIVNATLVDFGFSCLWYKSTSIVGGTFGYQAPECYKLKDDRSKYGLEQEIFSLGICFLEAAFDPSSTHKHYQDSLAELRAKGGLAANPPLTHENVHHAFAYLLAEDSPLHPEIKQMILHMIKENPNHRPNRDDLEKMVRTLGKLEMLHVSGKNSKVTFRKEGEKGNPGTYVEDIPKQDQKSKKMARRSMDSSDFMAASSTFTPLLRAATSASKAKWEAQSAQGTKSSLQSEMGQNQSTDEMQADERDEEINRQSKNFRLPSAHSEPLITESPKPLITESLTSVTFRQRSSSSASAPTMPPNSEADNTTVSYISSPNTSKHRRHASTPTKPRS